MKEQMALEQEFAWGPACGGGISIGLALEAHDQVRADQPFRWRGAIRWSGGEPREVIISDDFDPAFRYRLQVRRPGGAEPLFEFPPQLELPMTTVPRSPTKVLLSKGTLQELPGGDAGIDGSWGSGVYELQLLYGGPGFRFLCRSSVVSVRVA